MFITSKTLKELNKKKSYENCVCPSLLIHVPKFRSIISLYYLEIKYILAQALSKKFKYNLKRHPVTLMEKNSMPSVQSIVH